MPVLSFNEFVILNDREGSSRHSGDSVCCICPERHWQCQCDTQYDGVTTFTCQEVFREGVCDVNNLFPQSCGLGCGSIVAGLVLGVAAQFQASHFTHPTACGLQTTVWFGRNSASWILQTRNKSSLSNYCGYSVAFHSNIQKTFCATIHNSRVIT